MGETSRFRELVSGFLPNFPPNQVDLWVRFYELVLLESKQQNLTTALSAEQFFEVHFLDCAELAQTGFLSDGQRICDLGSGAGVPGLGTAILAPGVVWVLCESERAKADFLERAVLELGLGSRVSVFYGRAENYLL